MNTGEGGRSELIVMMRKEQLLPETCRGGSGVNHHHWIVTPIFICLDAAKSVSGHVTEACWAGCDTKAATEISLPSRPEMREISRHTVVHHGEMFRCHAYYRREIERWFLIERIVGPWLQVAFSDLSTEQHVARFSGSDKNRQQRKNLLTTNHGLARNCGANPASRVCPSSHSLGRDCKIRAENVVFKTG